MQTFEQFAKKHNVSLTYIKRANRPNASSDWDKKATHYNCTLHYAGEQMSFWYSMGSFHKVGPKVAEVLHSLASDAQSTDDSFEDWCDNRGYDSDSRKAFATYEAYIKISFDLQQLFGPVIKIELLDETSEDGE